MPNGEDNKRFIIFSVLVLTGYKTVLRACSLYILLMDKKMSHPKVFKAFRAENHSLRGPGPYWPEVISCLLWGEANAAEGTYGDIGTF